MNQFFRNANSKIFSQQILYLILIRKGRTVCVYERKDAVTQVFFEQNDILLQYSENLYIDVL